MVMNCVERTFICSCFWTLAQPKSVILQSPFFIKIFCGLRSSWIKGCCFYSLVEWQQLRPSVIYLSQRRINLSLSNYFFFLLLLKYSQRSPPSQYSRRIQKDSLSYLGLKQSIILTMFSSCSSSSLRASVMRSLFNLRLRLLKSQILRTYFS